MYVVHVCEHMPRPDQHVVADSSLRSHADASCKQCVRLTDEYKVCFNEPAWMGDHMVTTPIPAVMQQTSFLPPYTCSHAELVRTVLRCMLGV